MRVCAQCGLHAPELAACSVCHAPPPKGAEPARTPSTPALEVATASSRNDLAEASGFRRRPGDTEPAPAPGVLPPPDMPRQASPRARGGVVTLARCGPCRRTFNIAQERHETFGEALACLTGKGWQFERNGGGHVVDATCPECGPTSASSTA